MYTGTLYVAYMNALPTAIIMKTTQDCELPELEKGLYALVCPFALQHGLLA